MVKTKGKKRNIKMRQTMKKGGYYCIFENPANYNPAECSDCTTPCIQPTNYFYYAYNDTLFAYKPHAFKHFDTIHGAPVANNRICSKKMKDGAEINRIFFSFDYRNLTGNMPNLINYINGIIRYLRLEYIKMKENSSEVIEADYKYYVYIESGYRIFWVKKNKPKRRPARLQPVGAWENIRYCVQITHINKVDEGYKDPNCTIDSTGQRYSYSKKTKKDVSLNPDLLDVSPKAEAVVKVSAKKPAAVKVSPKNSAADEIIDTRSSTLQPIGEVTSLTPAEKKQLEKEEKEGREKELLKQQLRDKKMSKSKKSAKKNPSSDFYALLAEDSLKNEAAAAATAASDAAASDAASDVDAAASPAVDSKKTKSKSKSKSKSKTKK